MADELPLITVNFSDTDADDLILTLAVQGRAVGLRYTLQDEETGVFRTAVLAQIDLKEHLHRFQPQSDPYIVLTPINGATYVESFGEPRALRSDAGEIYLTGYLNPGPDPDLPVVQLPEGWRPEEDTDKVYEVDRTWWITKKGEVFVQPADNDF